MSIRDRVDRALLVAMHHRGTKQARHGCTTCAGTRLVVQLSAEMHDALLVELQRPGRPRLLGIKHYRGAPVHQLPHLPQGTVQVVDCWDCCEMPTLPDDPEAIARFLT